MADAAVQEEQTQGRAGEGGRAASAAIARLENRLRLAPAFAAHGLDLGALSDEQLDGLGDALWARLAPLFDELVDDWQEAQGLHGEQERVDHELRRRITAEKTARTAYQSDYECEGCGYRYYDHCAFSDFHGLFLCDGCVQDARDELHEIQRPLIEALEAEPTLARARALGFELTRRDDGRLVWVGEDDDYDGGSCPYTDERAALDDLVEELTA